VPGRLQLERRTTAAGAWAVVTTIKAHANGTFSLRLTPTADRWYRLLSGGKAVSPRVSVGVQPALTLAVVSGHFRASMYPALPGEELDLYQQTSGGWVKVSASTAGQHGHAVFPTAPAAGTWRVHYVGDATHRRGHSAAITLP
jgi:hypothetical protein